jgi:hypothetical protein
LQQELILQGSNNSFRVKKMGGMSLGLKKNEDLLFLYCSFNSLW